MTGYAVSARIQRVRIATLVAVTTQDSRRRESDGEPATRGGAPGCALEELVGRSPWARFRDLREDLVTGWNQTTFFLFDPESWR
jgi:hypothetical protein